MIRILRATGTGWAGSALAYMFAVATWQEDISWALAILVTLVGLYNGIMHAIDSRCKRRGLEKKVGASQE